MIWDSSIRRNSDSPVVRHIVEEALRTAEALGTEPPSHIRAVAEAVDHYLAQGQSPAVTTETLFCLAGEALRAVGESRTAAQLVLFGSGLVRSQEWAFAGEDPVWVVDLGKMGRSGDVCTELAFFRSLAVVTTVLADVWDPTAGMGVLGLKNTSVAARKLGRRGLRAGRKFRAEIAEACEFLLTRQKEIRGWRDVPAVRIMEVCS